MALPLGRLLDPPSRPVAEAVIAATIVAALHALLRMSGAVAAGAFNDDAVYVALGKSIADGTGYHSIYSPGDPVHLKYPPGLPLLVAVLWKLGGSLEAVTRFHAWATVIVMGVSGGLLWWLARRELELALPVALPLTLGPLFLEGMLQYFHLVLSEPYYVCAWMAGLVLYASIRRRRSGSTESLLCVALGLVIALAVLFRTQAIVLIPAFGLAMLVDRLSSRTVAVFAAIAVAPVVAWSVAHQLMIAAGPISTQPDEAGYASWLAVTGLGDVVQFAVRSLRLTSEGYWRYMSANLADTRVAGSLLVLVLAALALLGAVLQFRRLSALALSVAATAAVLALWPWPQDRLAFSMVPAAGLLAGSGIQTALQRTGRAVIGGGYAALTIIALSIGARQVEIRRSAYWHTDPAGSIGVPSPGYILLNNTKYLVSVTEWVRANTSPEDRIFAHSPAAVFLYTGRQGVSAAPAESGVGPSLFEIPGRYLASRVMADGVTVVIAGSPQISRELSGLERACPGSATVAGVTEGWVTVRAYRVEPDRACLEDKLVRAQ